MCLPRDEQSEFYVVPLIGNFWNRVVREILEFADVLKSCKELKSQNGMEE